MNRHHRRQALKADRVLNALHRMETRMSAASDALLKGLSDLSAKLGPAITDVQSKVAEAVAAQQAKDDAAFNQAMDQVNTMLGSLAPHADAVVQMASAVASGAGTAQPAPPLTVDVAPASTETAVQADPVPAAPSTSAEAADAAPASSSDAPASTEATGDMAQTDADTSVEDATATSKRKR